MQVVYIAPMKALVAEMVGNFQKRLDGPFGIKTKELTGARLYTLRGCQRSRSAPCAHPVGLTQRV